MTKFLYTILLFLFSFSVLNAEIKMIQLKVVDPVNTELKYKRTVEGGFEMNDQTSYMLPVANKRIEGFRMPFIRNYAHEVLLVGPFLDMCGDIQILDQDNKLITTIKPTSFVSKGKRKFYFTKENKIRDEGYVHFKISSNTIANIRTQNFKIKVGPIDAWDVVDCKKVNRFEIEAILFQGTNVPTREMTTDEGVSTVKNTFEVGNNYNVTIKLKGGVLPEDRFKFGNGVKKSLLYQVDNKTISNCKVDLEVTSNITLGKLIVDNDVIKFTVRSKAGGQQERRDFSGYFIAISDNSMGSLATIDINDNAEPMPFGAVLSKTALPDFWGPYVFARLAKDIYKFGQYTDLGVIKIGDCNRLSSGSGSAPRAPISVGGGNSGSSNIGNSSDPEILTLSYQNALIYDQSETGFDDGFPGLNINVCRQANDPNPKVTTIPKLKAVVRVSPEENFIGTIEIRFKRNNQILFTSNITNIDAGQSKFVEFNRPENRLCTTNPNSNSAICKRCGDGISGIRHWDDEDITIEMLFNGAVVETVTIPSED